MHLGFLTEFDLGGIEFSPQKTAIATFGVWVPSGTLNPVKTKEFAKQTQKNARDSLNKTNVEKTRTPLANLPLVREKKTASRVFNRVRF